jgi:hypothetical protein
MHTNTRLLPRLHLVQLSLLLLCAFLLSMMTTGCRSKRGPASFDTGMLNAMGSQSNKVLTVIQGGRQASSMFDKDSVLPAFAETAREAIKAGQEVSISSGVYGGLRAPKIDKMVDRDTLVQDGVSKIVAAGLMTAKNGGTPTTEAASLIAAGGKSIFEGMNGGDENPVSDESGLQFLTLSAGPDANKYHSENVRAGFATRQAVALADRPSLTSVEKTVTKDITTSNAWASVNAAVAARERIAAQEARLEELRLVTDKSKREGTPAVETVTDQPDADSGTSNDAPASTTPYDQLTKKNYVYKTRLAANNPVTRHDSAFLIPRDRPKPTALYIPGQSVVENYFSKSEDRWILRLKGALPNTPAAAVATYADGNTETFQITSLAGRTEKPAGPYKPAVTPEDPLVLPLPEDPATGDTVPVPEI